MALFTNAAEKVGENLPKLVTNMLAYQRSLELSEGMMFGLTQAAIDKADNKGTWLDAALEAGRFVEVREKGARGQSSHANAKTKDLKPGASNPQIVDVAHLPGETDHLLIAFSMKVMPNVMAPSATDDPSVALGLAAFVERYAEAGGLAVLAERYIANIANGRFAWRNRGIAEEAKVGISWLDADHVERFVAFDPLALDLETMADRDDLTDALVGSSTEDLDALISLFAGALAGKNTLTVRAGFLGRIMPGAEVYPSQEYVREESKKNKSRHLSSVRRFAGGEAIEAATLHNQKIGAAIRCIDDWHDDSELAGLPVPVNPYAGVQELNKSLRHPEGKNDFYSLRKKPQAAWNGLIDGVITDDAHFIVANLVRGGVYGQKPE